MAEPKFSVIIPAHNEENSLKETIVSLEKTLSDYRFEIIVVNDHSLDKTVIIAQELAGRYPNVRLVNNIGEKGFAPTLITGFGQAKGEFLVPVMADGCDDLTTIKEMYEITKEGYDLVSASRYQEKGKRIGGPKLKAFFSEFVGKSIHRLTKIPTTDVANAFKLYRKSTLQKIKIKENSGFALSMEITLKMYYQGYRIAEVSTIWKERKQGKSKFIILKIAPFYLKWYFWAITKMLQLHMNLLFGRR